MLAKTESVALVGADARLVEVEVDIPGGGLPAFRIVGLPTTSVREAEQRTRSALSRPEKRWPMGRIVANLAPGALRKEGTHFDLALALGVLAANEGLDAKCLEGWIAIGELALDGSLRPVRGALPAAITCREARRRGLLCPAANAPEAALVDGIEVVPLESLEKCLLFLKGEWVPPAVIPAPPVLNRHPEDLRDVRGHAAAKKALEIAAAGGHNLLMTGAPGSGKTMLAQRLPGILPPLTPSEALTVTKIYSVAGLLAERPVLIRERPFRMPHHHISMAGLIGGGAGLARPGEASLAHHGVLFLDELTLYSRQTIEALRGPLEDGLVRIARSGGSVTFPCRVSLVAAMNPCPCGFFGDWARQCDCSSSQIIRYTARVSGPLKDRFDMQIEIARPTKDELLAPAAGDSSAIVRERVLNARARQERRYGGPGITNSSAKRDWSEAFASLTPAAREFLGSAIETVQLTGRGLDRVLRVSRTIADLDDSENVTDDHLAQAVDLRLESAEEVAA